jgi:hypothetical protein
MKKFWIFIPHPGQTEVLENLTHLSIYPIVIIKKTIQGTQEKHIFNLKDFKKNIHIVRMSRGRILGKNLDKGLKSFLPCYSQSPYQLCREISISFSSNSRNLSQFLQFSSATTLGRRKEEKLIRNHSPFDLRNSHRNLKSEKSHDYAQKTKVSGIIEQYNNVLV